MSKVPYAAIVAMTLALGAGRAVGGMPAPEDVGGVDGRPRSAAVPRPSAAPHPAADLSGRRRTGTASFYAPMFTGRTMADGNRMDPRADNAASRTLPLGTTAKVTNLETGRSAQVTIEDRGPYVAGRIVDLSPATARKIGISRHDGIAKVAVAPIDVPLPGGGVKHAAAAGESAGPDTPAARLPR